LRALYVPQEAQPIVDIAELGPQDVARRVLERESREHAESLLRRTAARAAIGDVAIHVLDGHPLDEALAEMRCADLAILSQPEKDDGTDFGRRLLANAILGNGTPVLVLPYAQSTAGIGDNVVVAWDGGREAARAMRDALPILASAASVTLLSIGARAITGEDIQRSQERALAFLSAHGVHAQSRRLDSTLDDPAELLLSQLADLGADLVVMGAYGHARLRELILGGVTRTMLQKMTVPVFVSH
jgi:nucleotide-binding universal stress UspA family protein